MTNIPLLPDTPPPTLHRAGPMVDLVQRCSACLCILIDYRNTAVAERGNVSWAGFEEGETIATWGKPINMWSTCGDYEGAAACSKETVRA